MNENTEELLSLIHSSFQLANLYSFLYWSTLYTQVHKEDRNKYVIQIFLLEFFQNILHKSNKKVSGNMIAKSTI